jgi:hypothetical protein
VRASAAAPLLAVLVLLAGCGSGAMSYPPSGIDGLTIPTPSPDPSDFVARITNPWLELTPGRVMRYDVKRTGRPDATRTVTVLPGTVTIDGVRTTAVRDDLTGAETTTTRTDYYAQDRAGNVWWFGQQGLWRAGREGAEAGLLLTATPRLGDGYRAAYAPGVVEDVITVAQARPIVSLERTSELEPGGATWDTYRKGVGLTERLVTATGERDVLEAD